MSENDLNSKSVDETTKIHADQAKNQSTMIEIMKRMESDLQSIKIFLILTFVLVILAAVVNGCTALLN